MPTPTTYPGVYIEELFNFSLSVSASATAVPIFADNPASSDDRTDQAVRIDSWLDFTTHVGEFRPANHAHVAMRAYFENGGGYCYLLKADKMAAEVPKLDDVTLLVSAGWDISSAVNTLCKPGSSLFAILDSFTHAEAAADTDILPPAGDAERDDGIDEAAGAFADLNAGAAQCSARYYPYLEAPWAEIAVPPSAVMAGIYCSVDRLRGVWKAPANVAIGGGLVPKYRVTDKLQGDFNQGADTVNMIREFSGRGVMPWGARTCEDTNAWRYIPVRRLFDAAERDIKRAMRSAMFEPNTPTTWNRSRQAIDTYLHGIWQRGGLAGARPEEGYFIQVGLGETMTQDDVDNGRMIFKIGLAAVRPAEFIILQFTQQVGEA